MYTIDRKTASKKLNVSLRTIDRYIAIKKISVKKVEGRIWLNNKEIQKLQKQKERMHRGISDRQSTLHDMSIDNGETLSTLGRQISAYQRENSAGEIYKKLFDELKQEIYTKQKQLEGANYRVGQLEAKLKESIPLLEFNKAINAEKRLKKDMEDEMKFLQTASNQLKKKIKEEKTNKLVYLFILFILLLLQPLWLYLAVIR
jgi:hypothetical protein